ncbi:hypothetical protein GCM10009117_15100 [Gangjinia marincola]|uniref:Uncharacterized protein n=1 Tax=Gangjinia marincola TaxID=578463 RepID=A0ABP3XVR3_9FLAO
MKYIIAFTSLILSMIFVKPEPLLKYDLDKGVKIISTYSGKFNSINIFHSIITKNKNTDTYSIKTFIKNQSKVTEFSNEKSPTEPEILAHHFLNDNLYIIVKNEMHLMAIEINPAEKKSKLEKLGALEEAEYVANISDRTIIFNTDKDENRIEVYAVAGNNLEKSIISYPEGFKEKRAFVGPIDYINQSKYVESGSNNSANLYQLNDQSLAMVLSDEEKNLTVMAIGNSNNNSQKASKTYAFDTEVTEAIDGDYYVYDNKLFKLGLTKEKIAMSIFDVTNGQLLKSISMDDFIANSNATQKEVEKYAKKLKRSAFDPVLTVNENSDGNYIVRIDYVDNRVYNYDFMFHQQMMMQQQMMNNSIPKFGPNPPEAYIETSLTADEGNSFKFVLSPDLEFKSNSNLRPAVKDYENRDQLNKQINHKNRSKVTGVFTKNTLHLAYYNTYKGEVTIAEEPREVED